MTAKEIRESEMQGRVWSAVRSALTTMRGRMELAVSGGYEVESAYLDGMARDLTDAAIQAIRNEPPPLDQVICDLIGVRGMAIEA